MKDLLQKKYANYVLKPFLQWYLKKDRVSTVNGFTLKVNVGVFHPAYFFSSSYFSEFVLKLDLKEKNFLDVGCGSGILALSAYKKGANVTAIDINKVAVQNTEQNFKLNFSKKEMQFNIIESDLFNSLDKRQFDVIAINPPYFFKAASSDMEFAWNCGVQGEYFQKLFGELKGFCHNSTSVYLILSQNCEIDRIERMARTNDIVFELKEQRKIKWEENYIFELKLNQFS